MDDDDDDDDDDEEGDDDDDDLYFPRNPLESIQHNTQYNAILVPTDIVGPIN